MAITTSFDIKIALIGHVSVGKTTLLNALLSGKFSEVSKKRTTAGVNHFRIAAHPFVETAVTCSNTLEKIIADNRRLRSEEKIEEFTFDIDYRDEELFQSDIPGVQVRFVLSDFPGLNEAKTSNMYRKFITKSWDTFDCAIVVMDASQGVNTDEQVDLLKFVKSLNETYKNIPIIIICNKVDEEQDDELMALVEEVRKEVELVFHVSDRREALANMGKNNVGSPVFLHMSAETAFVYRSASKLSKDNIHLLEKAYFDKIGHEQYGKVKWSRLSDEEKEKIVLSVVSDPAQYQDRLQASNFDTLSTVLKNILGGEENQQNIIDAQTKVGLQKLTSCDDFMTNLAEIFNLQLTIQKPFYNIIETFWELLSQSMEKAIDNFEQNPWDRRELHHPFKQLVEFDSFVRKNHRFKETIESTKWQAIVDEIRVSMKYLVYQQLKIICAKFSINRDCGLCDPWMMVVSIDGHEHTDKPSIFQPGIFQSAGLQPDKPSGSRPFQSDNRQPDTFQSTNRTSLQPGSKSYLDVSSLQKKTKYIWMKVGDSRILVTENEQQHPDVSSKPVSKDMNGWDGMSRHDKVSICHSILLLKYDKVFCETFGKEIVELEGVLFDMSPKCRCIFSYGNRVQVPSSFSDEEHWANLAWEFCNMTCD